MNFLPAVVGRVTPCAPVQLHRNGAHGVTRPTTLEHFVTRT